MAYQIFVLILIGALIALLAYFVYGREFSKREYQKNGIVEHPSLSMHFEIPVESAFEAPLFRKIGRSKKVVKKEELEPRESAPLSGTCTKCKKKISLPFKCKYCGKLFCEEHRLPENHKCTKI